MGGGRKNLILKGISRKLNICAAFLSPRQRHMNEILFYLKFNTRGLLCAQFFSECYSECI